jgi:hypothetical protein
MYVTVKEKINKRVATATKIKKKSGTAFLVEGVSRHKL